MALFRRSDASLSVIDPTTGRGALFWIVFGPLILPFALPAVIAIGLVWVVIGYPVFLTTICIYPAWAPKYERYRVECIRGFVGRVFARQVIGPGR
jgi:hypothetical protein